MDSLIQDLQKTIDALETLGEKPGADRGQIDGLLDQLFQQKIDLVQAAPNAASPLHQQAALAMRQAAAKAVQAAKEPTRSAAAAQDVALAIAKLAKLLDSISRLA